MVTPYDWQEGIGNRAQYIEARLAQGAPVLGLSIADGILFYTKSRNARKIYEIYDRLILGAIGHQSDVEALRNAALEFAHREGYQRSEEDVTLQRVATSISVPIKRAFADFGVVPLVARLLFAEVGPKQEDDLYYTLEYDGDYQTSRGFACVAGTEASRDKALTALKALPKKLTSDKAVEELEKIWNESRTGDDDSPKEADQEDLHAEAILLSRANDREDRFTVLRRHEV